MAKDTQVLEPTPEVLVDITDRYVDKFSDVNKGCPFLSDICERFGMKTDTTGRYWLGKEEEPVLVVDTIKCKVRDSVKENTTECLHLAYVLRNICYYPVRYPYLSLVRISQQGSTKYFYYTSEGVEEARTYLTNLLETKYSK